MARALSAFVSFALLQAVWGSALGPNEVGITHGDAITIERAPFMALVYTIGSAPCGGVILNDQFILTTSTCCINPNKDLYAVVGTNRYEQLGKVVPIQQLIKHEQEKRPSICLVKLQQPLEFSQQVINITLDDGNIALTRDVVATLTGFGAEDPTDRTLRRLRQGQVPVSDSDWCKREEVALGGHQFCVGDENSNACYGDVGAAVTIGNKLVGLVTGPPNDCKYRATRCARISTYRQWISDRIAENQ